jgi:hypothetical protein
MHPMKIFTFRTYVLQHVFRTTGVRRLSRCFFALWRLTVEGLNFRVVEPNEKASDSHFCILKRTFVSENVCRTGYGPLTGGFISPLMFPTNSKEFIILKKSVMKKYVLILFAFTLFMACDELTESKLVGKWQLKTTEKNGVATTVDTVWYNFQSESVFALQIYAPQQDTVYVQIGLRRQQEHTLAIQLVSAPGMEYSDWPAVERSFTIELLSKKRLMLRSEEGYLYSFMKF